MLINLPYTYRLQSNPEFCWQCNKVHPSTVKCWDVTVPCKVCGKPLTHVQIYSVWDKKHRIMHSPLCDKCGHLPAEELRAIRKSYGLRRIFSGPWLGTLVALGFTTLIVIATFFRISVAIVIDLVHCLRNKERKDN